MKAHLPTIIYALVFLLSLLAVDLVRAGSPGLSILSVNEAET